MTLSICGTAVAGPLAERTHSAPGIERSAPVAERTYSGAGNEWSGPVAERTYSESPGGAAPAGVETVTLEPAPAAVAPAAPSDSGLGALAIVLISVGGVVVLLGLAYTARRVIHDAHPAA
jgi:hypothetical protein